MKIISNLFTTVLLFSACSSIIYEQYVPYDNAQNKMTLENVSKNMRVIRDQKYKKVALIPKVRVSKDEHKTNWYVKVELDESTYKKKYFLNFNLENEGLHSLSKVQVTCSNNRGFSQNIESSSSQNIPLIVTAWDIKRLATCENGQVLVSGKSGQYQEVFNQKFKTYFQEARYLYLNLKKDNLAAFLEPHNDRSVASQKRAIDVDNTSFVPKSPK